MAKFLASSVGKKYLMGITGLVWVGFVFAHMAGNLLIFVGADTYNSYGHALVSGNIIYVAEAVLILALLSHIGLGVALTLQNRASKESRYAVRGSCEKGSSLASQTMAIHGTIILVFLISHLLTFKFGPVYLTNVHGVEMRDLHKLLVETFSQPLVIFWYGISLILLGFHLSHGVGSIFQSLGLLHPAYQGTIKKISLVYSVVVIAGFLSQPIYIFFFHQ